MLIIGELINSSRQNVGAAIKEKNAGYIQDLALRQVEAGADYIDVNCGTQIYDEEETMRWLIENILVVCEVPLCIDSPSHETLAVGLATAKRNGKQQMVNSITMEKERYAAVLPLIQQYKTKVVGLLMDDTGMPETMEDRIRIVDSLVAALTRDGINPDDIYLDPLVKPISTGDQFGRHVLDTVRYIREQYPMVHAVCGLSNISFGLPNRKILNQVFMIQTMAMGMDGYILDPLDQAMMGRVYASRALLGHDPYCASYLKSHRKGLYR